MVVRNTAHRGHDLASHGNTSIESQDLLQANELLVWDSTNNRWVNQANSGTGVINLYSDGDTDTEARFLGFRHQDGSLVALLGHNGSDILLINNRIHSGHVIIRGEDTGGTTRNFLIGDPDARTTITGDTELFLSSPALGFYSTSPIALQTGVAVTSAGIHAALVALGLITA